MRFRIRRRNDDPENRRWFAILHGCGYSLKMDGRCDITRIFFPWFYIDLLTPYTPATDLD